MGTKMWESLEGWEIVGAAVWLTSFHFPLLYLMWFCVSRQMHKKRGTKGLIFTRNQLISSLSTTSSHHIAQVESPLVIYTQVLHLQGWQSNICENHGCLLCSVVLQP